jgi:phosphatidylglycerophosphate synthase
MADVTSPCYLPAMERKARPAPREAWVIAGMVDGERPYLALGDQVAGIPYLLRLAGELGLAKVTRIVVVWNGPGPVPDISAVAADPRLRGVRLEVATATPAGATEAIAVLRADRIWHRDSVKAAITAWTASEDARLAKVDGAESDAVVIAMREDAARLVARCAEPGGWSAMIDEHERAGQVTTAPLPYLGFTLAVPDLAAKRRGERRLVWSLRKAADGVAAKLLNRRISAPLTWLLMRTRVTPNHVTLCALVCAVTGGIVIGQGGYVAGVIGMLFVELGSIVDGVDGELARLKLQFSRRGQWLDTVVDDIGNLCYATGIMLNLEQAGVTWARPLWMASACAFALTQATQYWLIANVYNSGDLAAIPWAFQSTEFLSARPQGLVANIRHGIPKLLKRDFAVTLFVAFALAGFLEGVLLVFAGGALVFFAVFFTQFARNYRTVMAQRRSMSNVSQRVR